MFALRIRGRPRFRRSDRIYSTTASLSAVSKPPVRPAAVPSGTAGDRYDV